MSQPVTYLQKASHRLTLAHLVIGVALVFVASNFLFALSLRWLPGAVLGLGCLAAALIIIREVRKNDFLSTPVHLPFFALCMATGFTLCLLGGQGHIFYSADDWVIRDAVLADMSTSALPAYGWNGETWILRAPLGMYLLPGALGRLAGLGYAHALMFLQNASLTGLALYLIAEAFGRRTLGFLAIFVFFSGLDFFGQIKSFGLQWTDLYPEVWHPFFAYMSFINQLFWAPNHALPGWCFAALLALHLRGGGLAPTLLVFFAATVLWSPLAMMGALPFLIFIVLREPRKMLSPEVIRACLAGAAFLPVAVYLQADATRIPSGWMPGGEEFLGFYFLSIGLEVPHIIFVLAPAFQRQKPFSGALVLTIVLLCVIPFYALGLSNDFAMRASIVPLAVLAACFACRVPDLGQLKDPFRFAAWAVIAISAWTPIMEIMRNTKLPAFTISSCDLVSSWREISNPGDPGLDHYMARLDRAPSWLLAPPQTLPPRVRGKASCWPDHPLHMPPAAPIVNGALHQVPSQTRSQA